MIWNYVFEGSNPSIPTNCYRLLIGIGNHPFKVRNTGSNPVDSTNWGILCNGSTQDFDS